MRTPWDHRTRWRFGIRSLAFLSLDPPARNDEIGVFLRERAVINQRGLVVGELTAQRGF
jgi:hypothetical protein